MVADSHNAGGRDNARRRLLLLGAFLFLVALLPEVRNLSQPALGRSQWLLVVLAASVAVCGLLGTRRAAAYRASAFVLLNSIIALALLEIAAAAVIMVLGPSNEPVAVEFATARANPYFDDKPWADAFWAEQLAAMGSGDNYHPYVVWRAPPAQGAYVRVDEDGFRFTPGGSCTDDAYRIAMFGSSALWGWGVPDEGTIPAFLQAKLASRGQEVCVVNRGQNGYVSTQDLIELVRMVQAGERIDPALFAHGFNDASALFETKDAGAHYMVEEIAAKMEARAGPNSLLSFFAGTSTGHLVQRFVNRPKPPAPRWSLAEDELPQMTREGVRAYLTNLEVVRGISERAGFDAVFFWQPYAEWGRSPDDAGGAPGAGSFDGRQALIRSIYEAVRDTADAFGDLHFLPDAFVGDDPTVWLDYVHLAPAGNERVADLIVHALDDAPIDLSVPPGRRGIQRTLASTSSRATPRR